MKRWKSQTNVIDYVYERYNIIHNTLITKLSRLQVLRRKKVVITFENIPLRVENMLSRFKPYLEDIARQEVGEVKINFVFIDSGSIAEMNKEYREKKGPTDVLTFVYGDTDAIDEIIEREEISGETIKNIDEIESELASLSEEFSELPYAEGYLCLDVVKENAKEFGNILEKELLTVLVHSILHMAGYDHEYEGSNAEEMFKKQNDYVERIWANIGRNA